MLEYNAHVEWSTRKDIDDDIVTALEGYSPAVSRSPRGWVESWFSVPATDLRQAFTTSLALAQRAVPGVDVLSVEVLPTDEFDARNGVGGPVASQTVGVPEAAAQLGVTVQAIRARLANGTLQGRREGRDWRIPVSALEAAPAGRKPRPRPRPMPSSK